MNRLIAPNAGLALPAEAFDKYRGQWIALSPDASRILASDDDLGRLEDKLIAAGESPDRVLFDRVEDSDISLGVASCDPSVPLPARTTPWSTAALCPAVHSA